MAKYLYTSGKRKGKVYQEFYYTLNGQQIVNKKSFYCPVNTKWLSKEEFKNYILQLIENEYPNYLVVDELPEEPQDHIIYFLKQVNEDQSIYYDVYVYDNEEMKKIVFQGGDSGDLDFVTEVCNKLVNSCLKYSYNIVMPANCNVITDDYGYLFYEHKTHLYLHHYHGHSNSGNVSNFEIYTTISTEFSNQQLGEFLYSLNCKDKNFLYPANGYYKQSGSPVIGIYAIYTGTGIAPYNIFVAYVQSNTIGARVISQFNDVYWHRIVQIF